MFWLKKKEQQDSSLESKEVLSSKMLAKIRRLQLKASWLVTDSLLGNYSSTFKGVGMEFEKLREYFIGDDVRSIDWKVTARMRKAYVRVYREERQMSVILLIDLSSSMDWGTDRSSKKQIVLQLASILSFICSKNSDRIGVVLYTDKVEKYIPPAKGSAHAWNIIKTILSFKPESKGSNMEKVIEFVQKTTTRKSVIFIISDFLTQPPDSVSKLARAHDCTCVRVYDKLEQEFVDAGVMEVCDVESGSCGLVDSSACFKNYLELESKRVKNLESFFARNALSYFSLSTSEQDIVKQLQLFILKKSRSKRQAGGT